MTIYAVPNREAQSSPKSHQRETAIGCLGKRLARLIIYPMGREGEIAIPRLEHLGARE